ncbi:MAG: hypothetical protein B5M54_05380 [Candidatus Aminicenantes bacterium 4484_214]|nr:MAG: hypothetical protein B5M54_05380 [Candidatus Aminicenantes bacterium 4484_214]HDJ23593.1 HypC/HybG/HupF family hydrogenase formation chaperone [Candidatus Aminicenantes bacterium]
MCLGIPAKITELHSNKQGKVDYLGTKVQVDFSLVDEVKINDWVIVHAGFAIAKLNETEAQETMALLREYAQFVSTIDKSKKQNE